MIDNVHGDKDKTPPPSESQNIMLHAICSIRALPRNFEEITFLKIGKKHKKHIFNSQFAKRFDCFRMSFCIFLKSDASWIFRVIH